jgi:putative PIN family toxin of toxin-antitoxin system
VFDTVTLLQAGAKPLGPAGACLRMVLEDRLALFMSLDGLHELHDVLSRQEVRRRFPLLRDEHVEAFLEGLRAKARIEPAVPSVFRYARDPNDEHVLNLTIACQARFLLTHDNDLLDLMKEGSADGRAFRARAPQLSILTAPDFLLALRAEQAGRTE